MRDLVSCTVQEGVSTGCRSLAQPAGAHLATQGSQCCTRSTARSRRRGCTSAASCSRRTRAVPSPCLASRGPGVSAHSPAALCGRARTGRRDRRDAVALCAVNGQSASCKSGAPGRTQVRGTRSSSLSPLRRRTSAQRTLDAPTPPASLARRSAHLRVEQQRATPRAYDLALRRGASCAAGTQ